MANLLFALSAVAPGVDGPARFLTLGALAAMIMGAARPGFAGGVGLPCVPVMVYARGDDSRLALGLMLHKRMNEKVLSAVIHVLPAVIGASLAVKSAWRSWGRRGSRVETSRRPD